jgi:hypothetical protein
LKKLIDLIPKKKTLSLSSIKTNLLKIMLFLWAAHISVSLFYFTRITEINFGKNPLLDLFFFEFEKNLPSFFSAFLLLVVGYLLIYIGNKMKAKGLPHKAWKGLGYVFYFLMCDEWFSIHEGLNGLPSPYFPAWVLVYVPLALIVFLCSINFLRSLPKKIFWLTLVSGFLYVSGAVLFEVFSALFAQFQFNDITYQIIIFLEDGCELGGAMLFVHTLITFIKTKFNENQIELPYRNFIYLFVFCIIESMITYATFCFN